MVNEIKESIGLPFQIDVLPKTFKITTAYKPHFFNVPLISRLICSKIDPERVIYRLDVSRQGFSKSQMSFKPTDIATWFLRQKVAKEEPTDTPFGMQEVDDIRKGFVSVQGMAKVRGPREMGGHMGTVEFKVILNCETGAVVEIKKAVLRVMGKKIGD